MDSASGSDGTAGQGWWWYGWFGQRAGNVGLILRRLLVDRKNSSKLEMPHASSKPKCNWRALRNRSSIRRIKIQLLTFFFKKKARSIIYKKCI